MTADEPVRQRERKMRQYCSAAENASFFQDGMTILRENELDEDSGDLIGELLEIDAPDELVSFARQWAERFPDHVDAAPLVGSWLAASPSDEVCGLAARYVRDTADAMKLSRILRALSFVTCQYDGLMNQIEERLKSEPGLAVWGRLQPFYGSIKGGDRLLLYWLQQNPPATEAVAGHLTIVAMRSQSPEILHATLQWTENFALEMDMAPWILIHAFFGHALTYPDLKTRLLSLTRQWLSAHPDHETCASVIRHFLPVSGREDDFRFVVDWYQKHKDSDTAKSSALIAMLLWSAKKKMQPEKWIVQETKKILKNQIPPKRTPAMLSALLAASPDKETISLAREACLTTHADWILARVLRKAPTKELVARANDLLLSDEAGEELVLSMLYLYPVNKISVDAAKGWIERNKDKHEKQGKIRWIEDILNGKKLEWDEWIL